MGADTDKAADAVGIRFRQVMLTEWLPGPAQANSAPEPYRRGDCPF
jgi:hypothetical protein